MQENVPSRMLTTNSHILMYTTATSMTAAVEGGWKNWANHESLQYLHFQADWLQHQHSQNATLTCIHKLQCLL